MRLDGGNTLEAQPLGRIADQKLRDEVLCGGVKARWENKRVVENLAVHDIDILIVERRQGCQHLVQENPERPEIDGPCVALAQKQLWRQVLGGSTEGVGLLVETHVDLAEAEVAQGDVALIVQENVLGLEVPVDDVHGVQGLDCRKKLADVELGSYQREPPGFLQVVEELATVYKRQHEVQLLAGLERELERHDERRVDTAQNEFLGQSVRDLHLIDDVSFADRLQRVYLARVLLPHLHHLAERPLADHLEQVEVLDGHPAFRVL